MTDALVIDLDLILGYRRASEDAYESVGIKASEVKQEPYTEWLLDLTTSQSVGHQLQAVRDQRLINELFKSNGTRELPAIDLVFAFIEANKQVIVVSHETEDALAAVLARANLPQSLTLFPMIGSKDRGRLVEELVNLGVADWLLVHEIGLTPKIKHGIDQLLSKRGSLSNVTNLKQLVEEADRLLNLVNERWSYQ